MPLPQTMRGVLVLAGSIGTRYQSILAEVRDGYRRTAIAVVPNRGHPMISRKDEDSFIVRVEIRDEAFGSAHEVVDDFYIFHVFLTRRERRLELRQSRSKMATVGGAHS